MVNGQWSMVNGQWSDDLSAQVIVLVVCPGSPERASNM